MLVLNSSLSGSSMVLVTVFLDSSKADPGGLLRISSAKSSRRSSRSSKSSSASLEEAVACPGDVDVCS